MATPLSPAEPRPGAVLDPGDADALRAALHRLEEPFWIVEEGGRAAVSSRPPGGAFRAYVPPLRPRDLGDPSFRADYGVDYAYAAGSMANGIASVELVCAMSQAGMLSFFGAAGLGPREVETAIDRLSGRLGDKPYGFNLIHSPGEPRLEEAVADLYMRRGVKVVEASAYLDLSPALVRLRVGGLRRSASGEVVPARRVVAKVSRVEVAERMLSPAPERILRGLVEAGRVTVQEAELSREIAVADDLTAEADSGGHTDNRPAVTLLPTMIALRDALWKRHGLRRRPRVGAAGGISTPQSAAGAFAMGADYVLGGSIHQACVESGSSDVVRGMLAEAGQADTAMAPAADMFEMGVRVQVLKRGTMFAMRAARLYDVYRACASLEAIPADQRAVLERDFFRASLEDVWRRTRDFFLERDPSQVERAERDPKHRMALVFRWYLGLSSRWANAGEPTRQIDYQVWCGPAMGAFNEWARGSHLEIPANRKVAQVARNILWAAAVLTRLHILRCQGVAADEPLAAVRPQRPEILSEIFGRA